MDIILIMTMILMITVRTIQNYTHEYDYDHVMVMHVGNCVGDDHDYVPIGIMMTILVIMI